MVETYQEELLFFMTTNGICSSAFKDDDKGNQTVRNRDRWGTCLEPARDSLLSVNSCDLYFIHTYRRGARSRAAVLYRSTLGRGTTVTEFICT